MHWLDISIIIGYLFVLLGVGVYFWRRHESVDGYFVGDRGMGAGHIGFSVVATDVGGGFSIGLGGLGFTMGLSGSWLLFTGLIGAWLAAVFLIPKVKSIGDELGFLTFPDYLEQRFDRKTRLVAAIVSAIGYAGFVGAQILAGAKLGSVIFDISLLQATLVMAGVAVLYTSFGGLKAVVYTDSIQWAVLLIGLMFFALPFGYVEIGGWDGLRSALPESHFSLTNLSFVKFITWMFTVIPIWFVGMTLYQRIYATKDVATAKKAWYLAGLLEWPLMAFLGVTLGMFARVMFPDAEAETGLPMLIRDVLPIGVVGLVSAAYLSAIMSTADSCLLASVGNVVNDIYQKYIRPDASEKTVLRLSQIVSLSIGVGSIAIALMVPKVLDGILLAYSFMVSGLFAPTVGGLFSKRVGANAAFAGMLAGGGSALLLHAFPAVDPFGEPILIALPLSVLVVFGGALLFPSKKVESAEHAE